MGVGCWVEDKEGWSLFLMGTGLRVFLTLTEVTGGAGLIIRRSNSESVLPMMEEEEIIV
jgi:hypothetical protein